MHKARRRSKRRKRSSEGAAPADYSVNALSALLGNDRRTIDKAVVNVKPTRIEGKTKFYKLEDVEAALARNESPLKDEKLLEEIRKIRIANDEKENLVVRTSKVADSIRRCLTPMIAALEQRLVNEYPTAVAGLDVPQARVYGKRLFDEIIEYLRSFEKEWDY